VAERWPGTGLNSEEEAAEAVFSLIGACLQKEEMFKGRVIFFLVSAFSNDLMKEE
jgi:hypothetical protein